MWELTRLVGGADPLGASPGLVWLEPGWGRGALWTSTRPELTLACGAVRSRIALAAHVLETGGVGPRPRGRGRLGRGTLETPALGLSVLGGLLLLPSLRGGGVLTVGTGLQRE